MRSAWKIILAAALGSCWAGVARAQASPPDPSHIPFILPANIQWTGSAERGEYQARLFGDPDKPGPYGILIKWMPGHYSRPHFHSTDRWAYVVSGTWWVSSSTHFDPSKTFPFPAGTFATDLANTVHWDGAKAGGEPAVIELVGMGPVITTEVSEDGKPLPPAGSNR